MLALSELEQSGAAFSPCRKWRYRLWRTWNDRKPYANFLMLNPSTADETRLDPTCSRCHGYAKAWGYGALIVTNLFAWRATDPADMKAAADPVGVDNDEHILEVAHAAGIVVAAWGNHGLFQARVDRVRAMLKEAGVQLHALRVNGSGQPAHPLYLPSALKPLPFS
jgi:hypothetical protein